MPSAELRRGRHRMPWLWIQVLLIIVAEAAAQWPIMDLSGVISPDTPEIPSQSTGLGSTCCWHPPALPALQNLQKLFTLSCPRPLVKPCANLERGKFIDLSWRLLTRFIAGRRLHSSAPMTLITTSTWDVWAHVPPTAGLDIPSISPISDKYGPVPPPQSVLIATPSLPIWPSSHRV